MIYLCSSKIQGVPQESLPHHNVELWEIKYHLNMKRISNFR